MKEESNTTNGDATIRQLMKSSKITAHENLKYRIMNQVETENALARKKAPVQKTEQNVLNDFLSIYGIMYAVLAVLAGVTLFNNGMEAVLAPQFLWLALSIALMFSIFNLIVSLDANVSTRKRKSTSKRS